MQKLAESDRANWCIVTVDNNGHARATDGTHQSIPAQYCRVGGLSPLEQTIRRAARIAPVSQILVTALEEQRRLWAPLTWFIRPPRRFISEQASAAILAPAAAILSVAAVSPSHVITILPGRCHVSHEEILGGALIRAISALPEIPEGIATLGMLDVEEGLDEDYLVVRRASTGPGLQVDGFARRPVQWVARHLRQHGALVSSGIMIGYAGSFADHILRYWPGLSGQLQGLVSAAAGADEECKIASTLIQNVPSSVLHSLRWHPPACRQRVFGVCRSGWNSLKSPRAVTKAMGFYAFESQLRIASSPLHRKGEATGGRMSSSPPALNSPSFSD